MYRALSALLVIFFWLAAAHSSNCRSPAEPCCPTQGSSDSGPNQKPECCRQVAAINSSEVKGESQEKVQPFLPYVRPTAILFFDKTPLLALAPSPVTLIAQRLVLSLSLAPNAPPAIL